MTEYKHFTLGNLYNIILFTFHVLSYFIIANITDNYARSDNQCHDPSVHQLRTLMMVLNTFTLGGNFVLGVEFNKIFNAIVEYERNARTDERNARNIFRAFENEFFLRVTWLLLLLAMWTGLIMGFTTAIGNSVLTLCFKHNFNEEYKQILMILIIADTTFLLNIFSFVYLCNLENIDMLKQYYMSCNLYNHTNDGTRICIGSTMIVSIVGGLWVFEKTSNTWVNLVFWVGVVVSAINIFAMMYKKAIYATSEIYFITRIGAITNIVASAFLLDDGCFVSDKNIVAMCCSNVFLLGVEIVFGLRIGLTFMIFATYFIICGISYLSYGLINYPETVPDYDTVSRWFRFNRKNTWIQIPEPGPEPSTTQTLHATTGLNAI